MKKLICLLSFIAILCATTSAFALDYTSEVSLSVNERYNDNIFLSHTNRINDFITIISPSIALSTKTESITGRISYTPSYNYYSSHNELSGFSHVATGDGTFKLSEKMLLTLGDTFVRTKDPLTVRGLETLGPTGPISIQETVTSNTISGNLAYKFTGQFSVKALGSYTTTHNSASEFGNVDTTMAGLQPEYRLTERTTLRAAASYYWYDYEVSSNADGQEYIIGINHRLTPTLTGDAYAGISSTHIHSPDATSTDFAGGISFTKTFETGTAVLAYRQGIIPGFQSTAPLLAQELTFRYTRPLLSQLDTSLSLLYGHYKSTENLGSRVKRTDFGASIGLAYRILSWARATLTYSFVNSDDELSSTGSYYNNTVMIGFTILRRDIF